MVRFGLQNGRVVAMCVVDRDVDLELLGGHSVRLKPNVPVTIGTVSTAVETPSPRSWCPNCNSMETLSGNCCDSCGYEATTSPTDD